MGEDEKDKKRRVKAVQGSKQTMKALYLRLRVLGAAGLSSGFASSHFDGFGFGLRVGEKLKWLEWMRWT
jgi:hypothetical protein